MIEVSHVSKSFGPIMALHDVSLRIERGERVAFVGSNGSGKTTLMRAILGLLRIEGRVTIAGIDVAKKPELALEKVAYIQQISPPLEAPISEVVRAHAALRGIETRATAEMASRLGLNLDAVMHTRFRDLSGGMKQKLLAARALATGAEALVCDEPTANLDEAAREAFVQVIEQRPPDRVVVICSHRLEEVHKLVDRVIELRDGHVAKDERCNP